ncbi:hypothetical protein KCMC57_up18360 [Kitasatospora sp. CMC57]|uniref:YcxB-like protein domain-containing protein n=1 Tax=Kitasatospora sp. CMC57 TaxID=3231513 RepID=A0AB33K1Q3_9ACTN
MDITATFRLTEQELRKAIRNVPALRRMVMASALIAVVGLLTWAVDGKPNMWMLVLGPVLLVLTEVMVVRGGARKSAQLIAEPWTVRITEQSYSLRTGASDATVEWRMYRQVTGRSGFWYLQQTNKAVGFVPQGVFEDGQRAELAEFFARVLPPVKRPWYRPF